MSEREERQIVLDKRVTKWELTRCGISGRNIGQSAARDKNIRENHS
jgi:hypothetical protein